MRRIQNEKGKEEFVFSKEELKVLFAAMTSMIQENHCMQDTLTDGEWRAGEALWLEMERPIHTMLVDERQKQTAQVAHDTAGGG